MLSRAVLSSRLINLSGQARCFSATGVNYDCKQIKVLIVGGGSGGCTMAAKLAKKLGKDQVIVIEPNKDHYYQPMFTLIGGGMKSLKKATRPTKEVIPETVGWIHDYVNSFDPNTCSVETLKGCTITYEYMIVALGLKLDYDKIPGLEEALKIPQGRVCSNYSPDYVERTYAALKRYKCGKLLFTYPNTPVKCPGAAQKVMYIAEHYLRKNKKREHAYIEYHSPQCALFGVEKYADALWKVVKKREIKVKLGSHLVEVLPKEHKAIFQNMDEPEETKEIKYDFLHVTPPMSTPCELQSCKELINDVGFLDVSPETLQHLSYKNIFGIGDCTSTPNSKTLASVAAQSDVVYKNLLAVMDDKKPTAVYDGYASCPLVTGYNSCILAEFDYSLQPLETFPLRQDQERYSMFFLKKHVMPYIYWSQMLKGKWSGPGTMRKIMSLGRSKK